MTSRRPRARRGWAAHERVPALAAARALALTALLAGVLGGVLGGAAAQTVTIRTGEDPNARLEVRTVPLPGGATRTVYVVTARRVVLEDEEVTVRASRLEFDPSEGVVRIVGRGRVERPGETIVGEDLRVELRGGRLDGDDMVVIADDVYVVGEGARRVEGRISVMAGRLAPCARCGQQVEDYAFAARRIELLPGDRLIAWGVVVTIRDVPVFAFPLLVLPLADEARSPRLEIASGNADDPGVVRVDWPYVAGTNAFGIATARLRLDVDPAAGGFFDGRILGGEVQDVSLAPSVDHRFYDARGAGRLRVRYQPEWTRDDGTVLAEERLAFTATYASDGASGDPAVSLRLARDDDARPDLLEATWRVAADLGPFRASYRTQLPLVRDPDADVRPTWKDGGTPFATPFALRLDAGDGTVAFGPWRWEGVAVDLGAFRDAPDPTNRSALGGDRVGDGRLEVRHRLVLERARLGNLEVRGSNAFRGRYYGSGERQVDWASEVAADLSLDAYGSLGLTLERATVEGETPFAFERASLRTRADLRVRGTWVPLPTLVPGTRLEGDAGWTFVDDRAPDEVGWKPTEVTLSTLGEVDVASLRAVHRADPRLRDLGTLDVDASLRTPDGRFEASATLDQRIDLDLEQPEAQRDAPPADAGEGTLEASAGLPDVATAALDVGWDLDRTDAAVEADETFTWTPVTLRATLGTSARGDRVPSLAARWTFDPEGDALAETSEVRYTATADVGAFRAEIEESYGPAGAAPGTHRVRLAWDDLLAAQVDGVPLLPGDAIGLPEDDTAARDVRLRIEDGGGLAGLGLRAELRATFRPTDDGDRERRDTRFEASLQVGDRTWFTGALQAEAEAFLDVPLRDDVQPEGYLRRANLAVGVDVLRTVGLQGRFGYRGRYDLASESVASGQLAFEAVTLTVRPNRAWTLGATLDDTWEVRADEPADDLRLDPRPTLFAAWDRCCWAAYARWDTRSGEVVLTLGRPGTREGRVLRFDEGPTVPWGEEEGEP